MIVNIIIRTSIYVTFKIMTQDKVMVGVCLLLCQTDAYLIT